MNYLYLIITLNDMLLLVSATQREVMPLLRGEKVPTGKAIPISIGNRNDVSLLISGVGSVPTTFHLQAELTKRKYSAVVSLGIAGSYSPFLTIGDVVVVRSEVFADYGIDDNGQFHTLFHHGLADPNHYPFEDGVIQWKFGNFFPMDNQLLNVKGVTVSTATGSESTKNRIERQFSPDIETMEGAAVFYTCSMMNVPFVCLRGISNRVEPRNAVGWNIPLAVDNVCREAEKVILQLP